LTDRAGAPGPSAFFREVHRRSPALSITGWTNVALLVVMLLAAPFDARQVVGINPWIKPLKFAVSIAIYVWTIAWFVAYADTSPRVKRTIAGAIATAMLIEIACIALQAARGTTSHYNVATAFDIAVFNAMGFFILVNTVCVGWLTALAFARMRHVSPRAYLWGIRLGLLVLLAGSLEGAIMIGNMAHSVGVPDGGPGLPFVNWSTQGGDLRAAHALGLHALQILPLAGWGIGRRLEERSAVRVFAAVAALYVLAFAGLFWMALQGRPLVAL
jgi:hypothetical protein